MNERIPAMTLPRIILGLSLAGMLALAGCGGTGSTSDPLTGTWSNATCYGSTSTPSNISSCSVTLSFTADLNVGLTAAWISMPATAMYPGCTTTKRVSGQLWSTDDAMPTETLTVTGTGDATMERTGCVNAVDDLEAMSTSDISIPSGDTQYQIIDGKLTILSSNIAGTYSL
jgi:hypothetical protein